MNPKAECIHCRDEGGNGYIRALNASEEWMNKYDADNYHMDHDPAHSDYLRDYPEDYPADEYNLPCVVFYPG